MTAFALGSEVKELLADPENKALVAKGQQYTEDFAAVKGFLKAYISVRPTRIF
ncbi:MAG: hypothetical protein OSJ72_16205 [Lachnospiraceae bacterium]|nr:hypothetical protein [Lachnospiraceae bacterium]